MKRLIAVATLACIVLFSGCVAVEVGTKTGPSQVEISGLAEGYVSLNGIHHYDGTILRLGILELDKKPGEVVSFELWPLVGVGVGIAGARAQVLPLEAGVGVLWYHPKPTTVKVATRRNVPPSPPPAAPEDSSPAVSSSETKLEERFRAAGLITDNTARNENMRGIAVDSAKAGNKKLTTDAIGCISDTALRDDAAQNAAVIFAGANDYETANEIMSLIYDKRIRIETLQKIAERRQAGNITD